MMSCLGLGNRRTVASVWGDPVSTILEKAWRVPLCGKMNIAAKMSPVCHGWRLTFPDRALR